MQMKKDLSAQELQNSSFEMVYRAYEDYMYLINLSEYTRRTYLCNFRKYYMWCKEEEIEELYDQYTVKQYLLYRVKSGAKWQTMNNIYSAMRKLFREVLNAEWSFKKLPRSKKEKVLPNIISMEEVERLIQGSNKNIKHQAILITLYATGIRVGELIKIKLKDVDSDRKQIRISSGKGRKDRYVQIPEILIEILRAYYKKERPEHYLFNGRKKGTVLSVSAIRWAMNQSKRRMKVRKKVSPHTFRHCYATHHLECGTDLVYIQQNLGHKHLKTTARYIHLCQSRYQHIDHPIAHIKLN